MYNRSLKLPKDETFFLWGPRQVGKTSLLKEQFKGAPFIQLLRSEEFSSLSQSPKLLRERVRSGGWRFVVIDEIQKIPALLDEIHLLIEEDGVQFALCGSSARKVRRGHANLLGGRALRYQLHGMTAQELGDDFDLKALLNDGYFPGIYQKTRAHERLFAYCADYLKEEIASEGLVRNFAPFGDFLSTVALGDTETVSFESIARDTGVSASTARNYFDILADTLIGSWLPAYRKHPKRRTSTRPKFYLCDVGIVNSLARRGEVRPKSEAWGKAFENWVFHELKSHTDYTSRQGEWSYWRLSTGVEVDFIYGNMEVAIEAKSSEKIHGDHLKGLREIVKDFPEIKKRLVISGERVSRRTDDGIDILSVQDFVKRLSSNSLF